MDKELFIDTQCETITVLKYSEADKLYSKLREQRKLSGVSRWSLIESYDDLCLALMSHGHSHKESESVCSKPPKSNVVEMISKK